MKTKPLLITIIILALVAGLVFWQNEIRDTDPPLDPRVGQPVFAPEELAQTNRILLRERDQSVTLQRDGDRWLVEEKAGLPAKNPMLRVLTGKFLDDSINRLVSSSPERIAQLGITGPTLEFRDQQGNLQETVRIGRRDDDRGMTLILLGEDQPRAYWAGFTLHVEMDAARWIDPRLFDFGPEEVSSIALEWPDDQALSLHRRSENGGWESGEEAIDERLNTSPLQRLLRTLNTLEFREFFPGQPTAAGQWQRRQINLQRADGSNYLIVIQQDQSEREEDEPAPTVIEIRSTSDDQHWNQIRENHYFTIPSSVWETIPDYHELVPAVDNPAREMETSSPESPRGPISVTTEPLTLDWPPTDAEEDSAGDPEEEVSE